MTTATERLPVLVTKAQKIRIAERARAAHMSMSEFLRQAAEAYAPDENTQWLDGLIEQVKQTSALASQAMDDALIFVAQSQHRIEQMETDHRKALQ